jgi:hypothetical protein
MPEEYVRILVCHTDGAVHELPDYDGPPEYDDTLKYRLSEHKFGDGSAHFGNMARLKKSDWDKKTYRDAILEEIAAAVRPGEGSGLGQAFYDVKDNFMSDAAQCWKRHSRTLDCGDYMTDKMRLYPDTKADRKSEGLESGKSRPSTFLCQFCPVHSVIQGKKNKGKY